MSTVYCTVEHLKISVNSAKIGKNRGQIYLFIIFFECLKNFVWIKLVPLLRSADLSADHRLGHVVGLHEISIISELMILTR